MQPNQGHGVIDHTFGRRFEALVWFGIAAQPLPQEADQDAGGGLLHKREWQPAEESLAFAAITRIASLHRLDLVANQCHTQVLCRPSQ
jgi:hypothetical protein